MKTSYDERCSILGEIWLEHRHDKNLADFVKYNDIGLPLAYFISEGIIPSSGQAERYINETFDVLLSALGVKDIGFSSFNEVMSADYE